MKSQKARRKFQSNLLCVCSNPTPPSEQVTYAACILFVVCEGSSTTDCCGRCGASVELAGSRARVLYSCYNCGLEYRLAHNQIEQKPRHKRQKPSCSLQDINSTMTTKQRDRKQAQRRNSARSKAHVKVTQDVSPATANNRLAFYRANKSSASTSVDNSTVSPAEGSPGRKMFSPADIRSRIYH